MVKVWPSVEHADPGRVRIVYVDLDGSEDSDLGKAGILYVSLSASLAVGKVRGLIVILQSVSQVLCPSDQRQTSRRTSLHRTSQRSSNAR